MKHYPSIKHFADVIRRKPAYTNVGSWVIQEKIEGMNMSIVVDPAKDELELRGRTTATDYDFSKVELPDRQTFLDVLNIKDGAKINLYGELCGGGIQREWYFDKPTFILFDIEYVGQFNKFFMDAMDVFNIGKALSIKSVPILGYARYLIDSLEHLQYFCPESVLNPAVKPEGIVAKPRVEILDKFGERVIYKTRYAHFKESV